MADQALRIPKFLGKDPDMMDLIKKWRIGASKYGLASLQLYLLRDCEEITRAIGR